MAWRIHDSVLRGEIDNRQRGFVRGKVWLNGHAEPVVLDLKGNACADLAGCLLTFENPGETIPMRTDARFDPLQRGTIGDLTASRKVRVPDVPFEEFFALRKAGQPAPEHMANCLYLEWFSDANGRVVIESHEFKLTISPPAWRLTPEEEQHRQQDAAEGFSGFVQKLSDTLEAVKHEPPEDKEWDEFDYEKFMREADARTDKYGELLDKYMDHPDRDRIIAKEMGWTWLEEALDDEDERQRRRKEAQTPGEGAESGEAEDEADEGEAKASAGEDDDPFDVDEMNRICAEAAEEPLVPDPLTEGVDWVRDEEGDVSHPLSLRVFNSSLDLWRRCKDLGLGKADDDDLCRLISDFQTTGAKLAGALDSLAYGRDVTEGPFIVARLKRALNYLHAAEAALERVTPKNLLPADLVASTRAELFAVREEILRLMEEFRGQK
ncbi:MAG: hypothetical protein HYY24_07045 [Verrucomicrobia bacterium]|nr:hypothetical protein [Verrucomicrobiota bacterium]